MWPFEGFSHVTPRTWSEVPASALSRRDKLGCFEALWQMLLLLMMTTVIMMMGVRVMMVMMAGDDEGRHGVQCLTFDVGRSLVKSTPRKTNLGWTQRNSFRSSLHGRSIPGPVLAAAGLAGP